MLFNYTQTTQGPNILSLSREDKTTQHPCLILEITTTTILTLGPVRKNTGSKNQLRTPRVPIRIRRNKYFLTGGDGET